MLNSLIMNTIENGLITTLWAILNVIIYVARPDDMIGLVL